MRRQPVILLALALVSPPPAVARDWGPGAPVRIATEGAYKPWNFRDSNGKLTGFEIDLVEMLCADLRFRCSVRSERWSRMLPGLERGRFDIVFAGMSITAARKTKATFTVPYASTPAVFVAGPGARRPATETRHITLPELNASEQAALVAIRKAFLNGIVGVQTGTTHEIFLREYIEGFARIRIYEDQGKLDADTASGRLTAMLVGLGYAAPLAAGAKKTRLAITGPQISGGPFGEGIGAAVRRGNRSLAIAVSGAIGKRLADGSIRKLSLKWFGFDLSAKP